MQLKSEGTNRESPGTNRESPRTNRESPGINRVSPGINRVSPLVTAASWWTAGRPLRTLADLRRLSVPVTSSRNLSRIMPDWRYNTRNETSMWSAGTFRVLFGMSGNCYLWMALQWAGVDPLILDPILSKF